MAENTLDKYDKIISRMPYGKEFLFIDHINEINENSIKASFTFREDMFFYAHHFLGNPVTPGVILTECMAQIGLVAFGIHNYLNDIEKSNEPKIALSSTNADFYKPVFPGMKVIVKSDKQYFRFNKLKCLCKMFDAEENLLCQAEISGMIDIKKL